MSKNVTKKLDRRSSITPASSESGEASDGGGGSFCDILAALARTPTDKVRLGDVLAAFGPNGFGAMMLFLGLVNMLPLPPGSSTVLGMPLLLVSWQLMCRHSEVSLPAWASEAGISMPKYRSVSQRLAKPLARIERVTSPRLSWMTAGFAIYLIGGICVLLSAILMLPLWGGNFAPAAIMALFGLGLMQRDGIVALIAWCGVVLFGAFVWWIWDTAWRMAVVVGDRALDWMAALVG